MVIYSEDPPTCTEPGLSSGVVCSTCGYKEQLRFEIPPTGHKMTAATCTLPSVCENGCGYTEGEALGHDMQDVAQLSSTCAEIGYTAHKVCLRCNYTIGREEIPKRDHSYTISVKALAPTCSNSGYTAHKACRCGATDDDYEIIPATHNWMDADCTSPQTCSICGITNGKAYGHSFVSGICQFCGASSGGTSTGDLVTETLNIIAKEGVLTGKTITWKTDDIIFTNIQANSQTEINTSDKDRFEVFEDSEVTISGTKIIKVVIMCVSGNDAIVGKASITTPGVTATIDRNVLTIEVNEGTVDIIEFVATDKWRLSKIEVTYEK